MTGASGFLGSHIADALETAGHELVVFDRQPPVVRRGRIALVADLNDPKALADAVQGVDFVYHLAALADLNDARLKPVETAENNIVGTVRLLDAAARAGVKRFLFASTVYVYSRQGGFYRCSKQACEAYIEEFRQVHGMPYTVLRYGSLYGPRAPATNGIRRLLGEALDGRIRYWGRPDDVREYVHVEDAARLSLQALAPEFADQHVTLTGHHPMRFADLVTMFSEILGRPIQVDYEQPGDAGYGHYSVTPYAYAPKVGRKLTSNSYVDMGQGLIQCLEEMRAGGGR